VSIIRQLRLLISGAKDKLGSDQRNSKALLSGITTISVRFIAIGTGLISIPITAQYLGKEQFGVWLILSTFMNWISIADLGLTNSLVNMLSTALAKDDKQLAKKSVSSSFFPMFTLGLLILVLCSFLSLYTHMDQYLNLKISPSLQIDTHWSVAVAICFFAIKIPLSIPRCVFNAYQQGYIYQLWSGSTNFLSLLSLFVMQYFHANLPWLLGGFFGIIILGDILAGIDIFYFRQTWLKPKLKMCDMRILRSLLKVGGQFWIIQISAICIFQTDIIIVSQMFSLADVSIYGVLLKLFALVEGVSASFLSPLWPAYSNAKANKDYQWIKKTFWNSTFLALLWSMIAGSVLLFLSPFLVNSLLGEQVFFSMQLPFCMFITGVLLSASQSIATLVNGLGEIKTMFIVAPISAITNIFLSIILGQRMGIHGITVATATCIFLFSIMVVGGDAMRKNSEIIFQSK
jgi:O-antigen/teichoic acid export membrane protein